MATYRFIVLCALLSVVCRLSQLGVANGLSSSPAPTTLPSVPSHPGTPPDRSSFFLAELLARYGSGGSISVSELEALLESLHGKHYATHPAKSPTNSDVHHVTKRDATVRNDTSVCSGRGWITNQSCLQAKCLNASDLFEYYGISASSRVDANTLWSMSPAILYTTLEQACEETKVIEPASPLEVWGYAFLCVTLINLCSLMGMVFLPLMRKNFYQKLLMYMVSLAVGTLSGSALLFLIPECFEMTSEENIYYGIYIWKCTTVLGGIYLFFLVERILKNIMDWRRMKLDHEPYRHVPSRDRNQEEHHHMTQAPPSSIKTRSISRIDSMNMTFQVPQSKTLSTRRGTIEENSASKLVAKPSEASIDDARHNVVFDLGGPEGPTALMGINEYISPGDSTSTSSASGSEIKSVAWMVIVGDGIHNFIDGLSIGAAFSKHLMAGVSVSLAVICEELPHELGDFAILLNAGMTMRQAMVWNFLSACMCYLGMAVGIMVGELTTGSQWIFALAGGMFLYISLVDMLPEMNHAAEQEAKKTGHTWRLFALQNAGMLSGYAIMLLLANFSSQITLEHV